MKDGRWVKAWLRKHGVTGFSERFKPGTAPRGVSFSLTLNHRQSSLISEPVTKRMRDISGGADTEQLTFSDASIAKTATKLGIPES